MRATGIVRKIDDLGRIVIPKEIRKVMRIREGESLEIYTGQNGEIIFKKYSSIGELSDIALQFAEILSKTSAYPIIITDKDNVIAVSGIPKRELIGRKISTQLEELIKNKTLVVKSQGSKDQISITNDTTKYSANVICPIVADGDTIGSVIMVNKNEPPDQQVRFGETEEKLTKITANLLAQQLY